MSRLSVSQLREKGGKTEARLGGLFCTFPQYMKYTQIKSVAHDNNTKEGNEKGQRGRSGEGRRLMGRYEADEERRG